MPSIEVDIKELLDKLDKRLDKVDERLETIGKDIAELKTEVKVLDEKVDGIGKRLDNQEFFNRGILFSFTGLIATIFITVIGIFVKVFGFVGNS